MCLEGRYYYITNSENAAWRVSGEAHLFIESTIHICTIDGRIECEVLPVFPLKLFKLTVAWGTVPFKVKSSISHLQESQFIKYHQRCKIQSPTPWASLQQDISNEQDMILTPKPLEHPCGPRDRLVGKDLNPFAFRECPLGTL